MKEYQRFDMLRDALIALASDAQEQIRHLHSAGLPVCVDELALDYDAIAAAVPDMVEHGEIDAEQVELIRSLNEQLKQMSGPNNAHLWTEDALFNSPEWVQIRHAAKQCLSVLSDKRP